MDKTLSQALLLLDTELEDLDSLVNLETYPAKEAQDALKAIMTALKVVTSLDKPLGNELKKHLLSVVAMCDGLAVLSKESFEKQQWMLLIKIGEIRARIEKVRRA